MSKKDLGDEQRKAIQSFMPACAECLIQAKGGFRLVVRDLTFEEMRSLCTYIKAMIA